MVSTCFLKSSSSRSSSVATWALGRCRSRRDGRLHPFQVPITDLVPEEVVNRMGRFVETVASESFVDLLRDGQQARKNPAVGQPEVFRAGHRLKAHAGNRL